MGEVERPLFKAVMEYTDGNQSQAAGILGINRGTLRKKLKYLFPDSVTRTCMFTVRRALVSVSDKRELIPFVSGLAELGVRNSLHGRHRARQLRDAGIRRDRSLCERPASPKSWTVASKHLHPKIHGGLLGRRGTDETVMDEHGIEPIDMLVVNLYPFEQTIARDDATIDDAIENIDIGGPAMIRAASKNHDRVAVIVDPSDYNSVLTMLKSDQLDLEERRRLAAKAYAHTAELRHSNYEIPVWLAG